MALSNIFREPRREITETVVGIGIFSMGAVPLSWGEYRLWDLIRSDVPHVGDAVAVILLSNIVLIACGTLSALLVMGIHALGDAICTGLEKRGIQLRPRRRY